MSFPSPDSSTHMVEGKKRKNNNHKRKRSKKRKEKSEEAILKQETAKDAIQNDVVNSTQEMCEVMNENREKKENEVFLKLEKREAQIRKKIKASTKLLKDYERNNVDPEKILKFQKDFKLWSSDREVMDVKPLSEYVDNKKLLYKELFKTINKKQFKKILPKNLKQYDAREVKKWCLGEVQRISKKNLLAALNGEQTELSSSEEECSEENKTEETTKEECLEKNESEEATKEESLEEKITEEATLISAEKDLTIITNTKAGDVLSVQLSDNQTPTLKNDTEDEELTNKEVINKEKPEVIPKVNPIHNVSEVFEEMIKTPDQNEVDELMICKINDPLKILLNKEKNDYEDQCPDNSAESDKKDQDQNDLEKNEENTEKRSLEILELELRARALKSFIEAKERKKAIKNKEGVM